MSATRYRSGSARVSRAGDGVAPSRTFLEAQPRDGAHYCRRRLPHFEKPWAIYAVTIGTKTDRCLSPKARTIVLNWLRHFHNQRYELFAACVMPDHVYLLLQPWPKGNDNNGNVVFWALGELMHSINPWGACVAGQNEDYPWVWTQDDDCREESSFRRDAETRSPRRPLPTTV